MHVSTPTPAITLRLLGEPQLLRDGSPVCLPASRKTRALLAYLAATHQPQHRHTLCELLWESPEDPRGALRWSLSRLRPLLAPDDALRTEGDRVRLDLPQTACDTWRLPGLIRCDAHHTPTAALRQAAAMFQGGFLEGLELFDCYRFQGWCLGERESYRRLRNGILRELIQRLDVQPGAALPYARQLAANDLLDERAHLAVLRCLWALGERSDANAYHDYALRLLTRELGHLPPLLGGDRARSGKPRRRKGGARCSKPA